MTGPSHSYIVVEEIEDNSSSLRLIDTQEGFSAAVVPHLGAMLHSVTATAGGKKIELLDRYSTLAEARQQITTTYKGSNLAPFPNRIKGGRYRYLGNAYQLPVNFGHENNAIHGLLYDRPFTLTDTSEQSAGCSIALTHHYGGDIKGYPFPFEIRLIFSLTENNCLSCTTTFTNHHDVAIPLGHGFHPYFTLASDTIDELLLQFPADKKLELTDGIPTGKELPCTSFNDLAAIGTNELDDCFPVTAEERAITRLYNKKKGLELQVWQQTGTSKYNYLQIYTPPHRKSIAIEPMSCAPDAFNNGLGLISLEPGESCSFSWGIRFVKNG